VLMRAVTAPSRKVLQTVAGTLAAEGKLADAYMERDVFGNGVLHRVSSIKNDARRSDVKTLLDSYKALA
ncbi:MAG: hypothetical protein FWF01_04310, partial [Alphaproteobacteria bacterium]|nr:hypothetical protein [Alphaproteobacteria bacterium]